MSSVIVSFRRFLTKTSRVFRSAEKNIGAIQRRWLDAFAELKSGSKTLSSEFGHLRVSVRDNVTYVGGITTSRFANFLRRGRAIEAFEGATRSRVTGASRRALRRMNETSARLFPDLKCIARDSTIASRRAALVKRGLLKEGEVIASADDLMRLIRKDPRGLGAEASRLVKRTSATKKLVVLGAVIAVGGVGLGFLCKAAADAANEGSGCIMYVNTGSTTVKYKIIGCSCPIRVYDPSNRSKLKAYPEDRLWRKMTVAGTDCPSATGAKDYSCVHCNWDETDPNSVHYVDKSYVPDHAYLKCEKMDALDAWNEIVGGAFGDTWNVLSRVNEGVSDSVSRIVKFVPWILGIVGLVIAVVVVGFVVKISRNIKNLSKDMLGNDDVAIDYSKETTPPKKNVDDDINVAPRRSLSPIRKIEEINRSSESSIDSSHQKQPQ